MLNFFTFDTLITPYIIGYIYFFGAIIIPILLLIYFNKSNFQLKNTKLKLYILLAFIFLEIGWRIFCEFFMVYFKIFLTLQT